MQFTIILSLLAFATFIAAAPVPEPQLGTASAVIGVTCVALPDECKAVGDAGKQAFEDIGAQREKTVEENGVVPVALTDTLAVLVPLKASKSIDELW
ncbi:hypothetical protein TWF102_011581 [Orbilia oligospora]|uniref:Uncharacterized protein n=1 Tax=Orbilia oligospora TaxID=2813651 RepID=A0A7C8J081_ORBOL|nr:hypothetical protein TWF102_011581 [Orbilia oligospora]KAF3094617.1 hypothetical protein TWF706_008454 [Orbilia oligospora]